jgi:hypothetical protein
MKPFFELIFYFTAWFGFFTAFSILGSVSFGDGLSVLDGSVSLSLLLAAFNFILRESFDKLYLKLINK